MRLKTFMRLFWVVIVFVVSAALVLILVGYRGYLDLQFHDSEELTLFISQKSHTQSIDF